jgi:broad specificity phosphatase PhoE
MILLRHGQTIFNLHFSKGRIDPGIPDPELTLVGREQAAQAAALLASEVITRIVSSPYTRAIETALIVGEYLRLNVEIDPDIRERAGFSCDIGSTPEDLMARWPSLDFSGLETEWWAYSGDPLKSGLDEPEPYFLARIEKFRRRLSNQSDWKNTLVVCHWGPIRAMTGQQIENGYFVKHDPRSNMQSAT